MSNFMKKKSTKMSKGKVIDGSMDVIGLISPIMTIPQVVTVWTTTNTQAISLPTWVTYIFISFAWVIYGVYRKEAPIIAANVLFLILDTALVIGMLK